MFTILMGHVTRARQKGFELAGRFVVAGMLLAGPNGTGLLGADAYELPPIEYSLRMPSGPIAVLREAITRGELTLDQRDGRPFLKSLLSALEIPAASQTLVFSKTSHQNSRIHPAHPRAIYFNDDVYLGWVQGGVVEVASFSPSLGMVFYVVDPRQRDTPPVFERTASCLSCHAGSRVNDVPGLLVRSIYPDASGLPIFQAGGFLTTPASPFEERWGGWYVTGRHGTATHLGNAVMAPSESGPVVRHRIGFNLDSLSGHVDVAPYLRPTSDVVALMVLEHQVDMHNRLTQASYALRTATYRQAAWDDRMRLRPEILTGTRLLVAKSHCEKILRGLLFADEMALPEGGIDGDPAFQNDFQRNARYTDDGRSLKDFQLLTRLFKYRCSYMIYSTAFADLPKPLRRMIYHRLGEILQGQDGSGDFAYLRRSERQRIAGILMGTLPELAEEWVRKSGATD